MSNLKLLSNFLKAFNNQIKKWLEYVEYQIPNLYQLSQDMKNPNNWIKND